MSTENGTTGATPYSEAELNSIRELAYQFYLSNAEENWLRAEKQLGYRPQSFSAFLKETSQQLRSHGQLASDILAVWGVSFIVATVLGMHYILEYLAALHSPIPTIDSSLTSFVLFQAIFLVIMFTGIVMLVALPHFIKTISSSVGSIYPGLYSTGPRSKGWTFWRSHILYFAPMYAFLLGLQALGFAIVMFGLGSLVEFIILKYAPPKSLGLKDQPKALGYCVFASAAASLCSLLTLPFIVPVVLSFMGSSSWGGIVIIGIFLLIHTASATVFSHKNTFLPNAIALIIAVTIVLSLMKPAQVAGGTLRYFRVGGRIPIVLSPASAAFDSDPSNSPSRTTHSVNVCLVLTIGNELFATTPKKGGCPPKASYLWEHPEEFGPIGIYNRSDCFIANVSPVGASVPDKGKKQ